MCTGVGLSGHAAFESWISGCEAHASLVSCLQPLGSFLVWVMKIIFVWFVDNASKLDSQAPLEFPSRQPRPDTWHRCGFYHEFNKHSKGSWKQRTKSCGVVHISNAFGGRTEGAVEIPVTISTLSIWGYPMQTSRGTCVDLVILRICMQTPPHFGALTIGAKIPVTWNTMSLKTKQGDPVGQQTFHPTFTYWTYLPIYVPSTYIHKFFGKLWPKFENFHSVFYLMLWLMIALRNIYDTTIEYHSSKRGSVPQQICLASGWLLLWLANWFKRSPSSHTPSLLSVLAARWYACRLYLVDTGRLFLSEGHLAVFLLFCLRRKYVSKKDTGHILLLRSLSEMCKFIKQGRRKWKMIWLICPSQDSSQRLAHL